MKNPKHEAFAQAVAAGVPAARAYREQYPGCTEKSSHERGSRLSREVKVRSRIDEIRSMIGQRQAEAEAAAAREGAEMFRDAVLSLAEKRAFLAAIVRTPVGQIVEGSPLCQRFKALAGGGFEITMPDKLRAIELDAKLAGELREKVDVAAEFKDLREAGINPLDVSPLLIGIARGQKRGGEGGG